MNTYVCHKVVKAFKIVWIEERIGKMPILAGDGGAIRIEASSAWMDRKVTLAGAQALVGGYYVQYADGYASWSPAKAFEDGYSLATESGLRFGQALDLLRAGLRLRRAGWNGKGMWIAYSPGSSDPLPPEQFWARANKAYASELQSKGQGGAVVLPCLTMKTATGEVLMGWLASQSDMLADDWEVVD